MSKEVGEMGRSRGVRSKGSAARTQGGVPGMSEQLGVEVPYGPCWREP